MHKRLSLYGRPEWVRWIQRTARLTRQADSDLVDAALRLFAKSTKLAPPPPRLDPFARSRGARHRRPRGPQTPA